MNDILSDSFKHSPIGMAICRMHYDSNRKPVDFEFIEVNQALASLAGLKLNQLINKKISSFQAATKSEVWWIEFFDQAIRNKQTVETIKFLNHTRKWHKVFAWPTEGEMFIFATIDYTTVKAHENDIIRKSNEKRSYLLKAIPDLILITNRNGEILEYNSENEQLLFTFQRGMHHQYLHHLLPAKFAEVMLDKVKTSLDTQQTLQTVLVDKELPDKFDFEARFVPIDNEEVLVIIKDISSQTAILQELERRDKVLQAVADASQALLINTEIHIAVDQALSIIGKATLQDRVYVFEVHHHPEDNSPLMSQRYEWTKENITAQIDNPDLQNVPMLEIAPRWYQTLRKGGHIQGNISEFPESEREPLEAQDIVSILAVPIQIEKHFWGFVGFDDCMHKARWKTSDVAILQSLASSIGNAIIRDRQKKQILFAQKTIAEREERYRLVLQNVSDAIGIIHPDGSYSGFSQSIESITGFSTNELKQKKLQEIIHPDDFDNALKVFLASFEKPDNTYELQLRIIHKTNQWVDVEAKGRNLSDKNSIRGLLVSIREITDRKKAEKALQESEEKYRYIAENTSDGILILDGNNEMLWASPAYANQLGFDPEAMPKLNAEFIYNNIHAQDRDELFGTINQAISNKTNSLTYTYRAKHTNGHYIWLEDKAQFVYDPDGKLISSNIISRDITERKKAEEKLIASENKFRAITETANDALIVTNEDFLITFCNPVFETLFGYKQEEIIGQKIEMLIPDSFVEQHSEKYQHFFSNPDSFNGKIVEQYAKHKNGHLFPVEISFSSWMSGDQRYLSAQIRDISQRKQAEQSINLLTKAVTQSPVSIMITNAHGAIEYVNPKFCEVSGYTFEEISGKNFDILKSESTSDAIYEELLQTINQGKIWTGELENRKKDGSIFWESVSISPITQTDGTITHYIAVKEDITHIKNIMLSLIKAKEQAEASDRLKTAFMNNISHEIRTPLNHILGFSNMLIDPETTSKEKQDFYTIIKKGSDRLLDTISNYMDIALLVSGNMKTNPGIVKLKDLLVKAYNRFEKFSEEKSIHLQLDIPKEAKNISLNSDPELLFKVVAHLTDNAIKFTNRGSVTIGLKKHPSSVEIFISDTGIGIEDEKKEIILSAFGQAETSDTRGHEGSGLGLTIARYLTRILGGELNLQSSLHIGTTVSVIFPGNLTERSDSTSTYTSSTKKPTLLIAEDHHESQQYLSAILSRLNYELIMVSDGKEAVDTLRKNPAIDLVLMDIRMPVMDGLTATKLIKSIKSGLPVIAISANALSGDMEKAVAAGCNDYLAKPVDRKQLINKIQQYI